MPTRKAYFTVTLTRVASFTLMVQSIDSGPAEPGLNTMSSDSGEPFFATRQSNPRQLAAGLEGGTPGSHHGLFRRCRKEFKN